jgi:two-component system, OmpR family, sensor histidine kinase SenX3
LAVRRRGCGLRRIRTAPSIYKISTPHGFSIFPGFWPVLAGIMGLLVTVAVLQYRWTGEASSASAGRIRAELESLAIKWQTDLYSEISAICTTLQVGPDSGARDTWNDYLERYVEWKNALSHESYPFVYGDPDLVRGIYIWEASEPTTPRLLLLNAANHRIEPTAVPATLTTLLARLRANSNSLSTAQQAWRLPGDAQVRGFDTETGSMTVAPPRSNAAGWQFDQGIPAIVHPIVDRAADGSASKASAVDWIVVILDMSVLQKRILPELAERYFGGPEELNYKLAVVATGMSPGTIYSSDPEFGIQESGAADFTMNIFGYPSKRDFNSVRNPRVESSSIGGTGRPYAKGPVWFPVIQDRAGSDAWLLELQHRAGPLQLVVNRARRNNLTISALVLVLLAASMAVLTFAGYRAQNFAKLQMDFVASFSHELRTPLTAIFSAGENIKDRVVRSESDMVHYGSIVTDQSRLLMSHVDRILLYASMRSGKDRYTLRPLEIPDILDSVRRNTSALIAEEACVLDIRIEPGLPAVLGDVFAICGCLENLITNAVKYGGDDRRIAVSATLHESDQNRKEVAISVEDHGVGIERSELKSIFEPFYRSPAARAAQIHGTGLGLSLAKHLAEAMGGSLSVKSEVGSGSVFTLYLQLAAQVPDHRSDRANAEVSQVER